MGFTDDHILIDYFDSRIIGFRILILGPLPLLGFDKDKIVKVRALDDGHEVPISNAWMHSDYPDIAFVDLGPDPVLPDPVDYVLEVEMAE